MKAFLIEEHMCTIHVRNSICREAIVVVGYFLLNESNATNLIAE